MIRGLMNLKLAVPIVVVAACLLVAVVGRAQSSLMSTPNQGGGGSKTVSEVFLLRGTVTLPYDSDSALSTPSAGAGCFAPSQYDDVAAGAQVVISDESGTRVAIDTVSEIGEVWFVGGAMTAPYCRYTFDVYNFPKTVTLFTVQLGSLFRGDETFSLAQAQESIDLTLVQ